MAKYDPDSNIVPSLAAEIPTMDNGGLSADLVSITWKLKEGLKGSDGGDVTAQDVVYSWSYCVDEDADGDGIRGYDGVPLRITYQTSTNAIRQATQALILDWWRQIGIETEVVHHDASVLFGGDPAADREASYRRFFADLQMYAGSSGIDPQQDLPAPGTTTGPSATMPALATWNTTNSSLNWNRRGLDRGGRRW